jgi:acetylornithine deacetylase
VIPEPTGLDLVPANAGALTFRLRIPGLAAHASRRTDGVSALEKTWPVFQALRELERRRNAEVDPLMRRWDLPYSIEIGTVHGGAWPSSVPDEVVVEGRFGVALGEPVEDARRELERVVADCCSEDPWLRNHPVAVEWWGGTFASGGIPSDAELVALVREAHLEVSGRGPAVWGAPYGSDLRLFTEAGIPTLQYGPGEVQLAHAANESVAIREVTTAARALALLALEHCRTDGAGA